MFIYNMTDKRVKKYIYWRRETCNIVDIKIINLFTGGVFLTLVITNISVKRNQLHAKV